ncbi:phage integrase SAM-like domain-containing protein [Siphonobacter sp.]|uniref:site-specific integrase n=1 Tax=Siphonobacter sp. TaxID=1869184 RepID=UPI003B3B9347
MLNQITLYFYLRASMNPEKPAALKLRITLEGKRIFDQVLGISLPTSKWDDVKKVAKGNSEEAHDANHLIRLIQEKINKYRNRCYEQKRPMAPNVIRQIVLRPNATYTFLEVYRDYLNSGEFMLKSAGTKKTYRSRYNTIELYLKKNDKEDLLCEDFNRSEVKRFRAYLSTFCGEIYQVKIVHVVRLILNYAVEEGYLETSPLHMLKVGCKYTKKLVHLTAEELTQLEDVQLPNARLEHVRDCYLFSCYTGLAYCDLCDFDYKLIERHKGKGTMAFRMRRQKTETEAFVPLIDKAQAIIEKYPDGLPVSSNPQMNKALKEIASVAQIDKLLTLHTGRKTFAMIALNDWKLSMEAVAKMMGHRNIRELYPYARVAEKRVLSEFESIPNL